MLEDTNTDFIMQIVKYSKLENIFDQIAEALG
jgi:hypothetical protein